VMLRKKVWLTVSPVTPFFRFEDLAARKNRCMPNALQKSEKY